MSETTSRVISWDYPYPVVPYFTLGTLPSPLLHSSSEVFLSVWKRVAAAPHMLVCFPHNN